MMKSNKITIRFLLCSAIVISVFLAAAPAFAASWVEVSPGDVRLMSDMYFEPNFFGESLFPSDGNQYVVGGQASDGTQVGRGPHGGYTTSSSKCGVCHSAHAAYGAENSNRYLTRGATGCEYCHLIGSVVGHKGPDNTPLSAKVVYTGGFGGDGLSHLTKSPGLRSGHEISGNEVAIPASSKGTITLTCTSCHMVHGVVSGWMPTDFWGSSGQSGNGETTADYGYKLLRANPSGVGSAVPNAASGVISAPATDTAQVNQYTMGVWCANCHDLAQATTTDASSREATFTASAKGVNGWHQTQPSANATAMHATNLTGVYSGPGQCYSCHRGSLIADAWEGIGDIEFDTYQPLGYYQDSGSGGLPPLTQAEQRIENLRCSSCHFGTADYSVFSPASDWPHMSNNDELMFGEWTRNWTKASSPRNDYDYVMDASSAAPVGVNPPTDYVCQRCHIRPDTAQNEYIISHRVPDHTFNFLDFVKTIGKLADQYSPGYQAP